MTMAKLLSAKTLRSSLPDVVARVKRGERFTLLYRSEPVLQLVPMNASAEARTALEDDPLYGAPGLGRSEDGRRSEDHDELLYGTVPRPRRS